MINYLNQLSRIGTKEDPGILRLAWNALYFKTGPRQRANSCGIDNETIDRVKKNERNILQSISSQLKSDYGYLFSPLKPIPQQKPSGKYRIICIPTVRDRIVQKALQIAIERKNSKYTKFNGINYGFVKNYGVQDAVSNAVKLRNKHCYVYKTDISAFFDNINRQILKNEVHRKLHIPSIFKLIDAVIDTELVTTDRSTQKKINAAGIVSGKGIRQGMPLSPLFANLYLVDIDSKIISSGMKAVRYADDIVFFADSVDQCKKIDDFVRNELMKIQLSMPLINEENSKTRIYKPNDTLDFLGIGITKKEDDYVAVITDNQKDEIKKNIFLYSDLNYLSSREITLSQLYSILRSTIKGYEGAYVDCYNSAEISNCMNQWRKSTIRDLLLRNYALDINKLSANQKKFLLSDISEEMEET